MHPTVTGMSLIADRLTLPSPGMETPPAPSDRRTQTRPPTGRRTIRLLLVDDHPVVRRGLAFCLGAQPHIRIVGEAANGQEALARALELTPDLVLMDIDMPVLNGLEATTILRRERPAIKVLIFSRHHDSELVLAARRAGANGYVVKQASFEELVRAIEVVHAGSGFFCSHLAQVRGAVFNRGAHDGRETNSLSPREQEVLVAIAEGLTNKEIAVRLAVGVRTVETYREGVMRKLGVRGAAALTKYAVAKGLVAVPGATLPLAPAMAMA